MEARFARASLTVKTDPHQWQTYEQYRIVHDQRLLEHHFIDWSRPNTLVFEEVEDEGVLLIQLKGNLYCYNNVILEVTKLFETRWVGNLLQVRGLRYIYIGYTRGGHLLLKYHNVHDDPNEYIHRTYSPETGEEIGMEILNGEQFPVMTEVLDELCLLVASIR